MKEFFNLKCDYQDMSPVIIPSGYTKDYIDGKVICNKAYYCTQQSGALQIFACSAYIKLTLCCMMLMLVCRSLKRVS
jgi:hypothetical protein